MVRFVGKDGLEWYMHDTDTWLQENSRLTEIPNKIRLKSLSLSKKAITKEVIALRRLFTPELSGFNSVLSMNIWDVPCGIAPSEILETVAVKDHATLLSIIMACAHDTGIDCVIDHILNPSVIMKSCLALHTLRVMKIVLDTLSCMKERLQIFIDDVVAMYISCPEVLRIAVGDIGFCLSRSIVLNPMYNLRNHEERAVLDCELLLKYDDASYGLKFMKDRLPLFGNMDGLSEKLEAGSDVFMLTLIDFKLVCLQLIWVYRPEGGTLHAYIRNFIWDSNICMSDHNMGTLVEIRKDFDGIMMDESISSQVVFDAVLLVCDNTVLMTKSHVLAHWFLFSGRIPHPHEMIFELPKVLSALQDGVKARFFNM